jgi:hypothetical protein
VEINIDILAKILIIGKQKDVKNPAVKSAETVQSMYLRKMKKEPANESRF